MAHFTDDFLLNMVIIHRSIAMSVDWRLHDSPTHDFPHHFLTFSAKLQSAKTAKCKKCYVREVGGHHFWLFWLGLRSPTGPRCLWWPVEAPGIARASEAAGGLDARIRSSSSWGFSRNDDVFPHGSRMARKSLRKMKILELNLLDFPVPCLIRG